MRRLVPWLTFVVMALIAFLPLALYGLPAESNEADGDTADPTTITRYDAVHLVDEDGDLDVTETIAVSFPEGEARRGIFRFFDEVDPRAPHTRRLPTLVSVTRDGAQEEYSWDSVGAGRYRSLRLGSEDATLDPGIHVYVLRYTLEGVLTPGAGGDARFHWDLVAGGWSQAIEQARATVSFPAPPGKTACGVGPDGGPGCTISAVGDSTVVVEAQDLAPRERLTLRADLPGMEPSADAMPWSPRVARGLGENWWYVLFVAAGVVYAGWWGRRLALRTQESEPAAPLQYAPIEALGPYQALVVARESVPEEALVATLLHAAERGAVTVTQDGSDEDGWTVTGTGAEVRLDPISRGFLEEIGVSGTGSLTVKPKEKEAGGRVRVAHARAIKAARAWALEEGLTVKSGPGAWGVVGVLAAFVAYWILVIVGLPSTSLALVPAAFCALGLPMLFPGASTIRTPAGRDLWSRTKGFERVLSTPSGAERFDFAERQGLYTAYVPWAVAFGCAEAWQRRYEVETGESAPRLNYVSSPGGIGAGASASDVAGSFSSTLSSAVSSYRSSSSSRSGGVGGGGGGGGGGSW